MQLRRVGVFLMALAAPSSVSAAPPETQLTCAASVAAPPLVRQEGLAELTADVVLVCNGSAPKAGITGNLSVSLNTAVTSRLRAGTSEALLLIDEPPPGMQMPGVNLFQGGASSNTITFTGIPFVGMSNGTIVNRVLRITNIRANADALGGAALVAIVSTSATTAPVSLASPIQTVAFAQPGLVFDSHSSMPGQVELAFTEGFATSFKIQGTTDQDVPGTIYNTESGFTPNPPVAGVGTADSSTELGAALSDLPPGVQLSVPASIRQGTLTIVAVSPPAGGIVPVVDGTATIVYGVTAANPNAIESITVPVAVSQLATTGAIVRGNLYPISTVTTISVSAPIPRVADVALDMPFDTAVLVADYQFHHTLASSIAGAPDLGDLGAGNEFADESVGCALNFPQGNGVHLDSSGLVDPDNFSLVVLARLTDVSGYRRLLDTEAGTSDNGWYVHDGKLDYYSNGASYEASPVFISDAYAEVALTVNGRQSETKGYVNGVNQTGAPIDHISNDLGFFKDNTTGAGANEESAGAIGRIRLYSGVLTDAEVATMYSALPEEVGGTCATSTPTVTPTITPTNAPTAMRTRCVGDCRGVGVVEIADLVTGVNIALGILPISACPAFENAQGMVDIAQLVTGVINALNGCANI
jgi:hypothetical protein